MRILVLATAVFAAAAIAVEGARAGGTHETAADTSATLGFSTNIVSLDPDIASDPEDLAVLHLIGGNLTSLSGYTGSTAVPGLASRVTTSASGLTYSFTLRSGLTFSDGTPLSSADVVATFTRLMTDKGNVNAGLAAPFASVSAPNPRTFVLRLKVRDPGLLDILSEPGFMILPKSAIAKGSSFFNSPVSAGLYRVTSTSPAGTSLTLSANSHYYGGRPAITGLTFTTVADAGTRAAQVQTGQLDVAYDIPPEIARQVKAPARAEYTLLYGDLGVVPNNQNKLLKDVRIRQALSMALNRKQIVDLVLGGGKVTPLSSYWPSTMPGYDSSISTAPNVAGAKKMLAGTACAKGCKITLMFNTLNPYNAELGVVLRQQWQAIGVTLVLDQEEVSVTSQRNASGDFQMRIGPIYDYLSIPNEMLAGGLQSNGGVFANFSRYKSPAMDALIAKTLQTPLDKQKPLLAQVNKLFDQDRPWITVSVLPLISATRLPASELNVSPTGFLDVAVKKG
jgi:ABC-type transport system substrate-binding protein